MRKRLLACCLHVPQTQAQRAVPAIAWAVLIFVLSSIPGNEYPEVKVRFADKYAHVILYWGIGWFFCRAFLAQGNGRSLALVGLGSVALGALYGATDEIHQLWVPARNCSAFDWIADCVGVVLGACSWEAAYLFFTRGTREVQESA